MKKLYILFSLGLFTTLTKAQITINSTDLMNAGEEYNMSVGDILQTVDFTTTGANTNWDFSALTYTTQEKDSFFSVSSIGSFTYTLAFDLLAANKANIVQVANNSGLLSQLPISITDIYNFYYKNTSLYRQSGMGATITGVQAPLIYNSKDIIYNFPVNFNDADSSNADGSLAIPGLGYFGLVRSRVNTVDGWGSITTPFGTFDALRVRSVVNETDSLYVDSLGFGIAIPQPETIEYKWLAVSQGVPILQITTNNVVGAGETVSSIRYRDSVRITSVEQLDVKNTFTVSPNPAIEATVVSFNLQNNASVTLTLYAADGKQAAKLENGKLGAGVHNYLLNPEYLKLTNGVYILALQVDNNKTFKKVVFTK
ncbi:MAG: T9SS type A sorting domain-containing protein [Bacteroidia bacterium]